MIRPRFPLAPAMLAAAALVACTRKPDLRTYDVPVGGMTCTACESAICTSVRALEGVELCEASFARTRVAVTYQPDVTSEAQIAAAIRSAGYEIQPKSPVVPSPSDDAASQSSK